MDKELAAVRTKYMGQCPYEKGHESEGFTFICGLFVGLIITLLIASVQNTIWNNWALKNEYAYYDKLGHLKWVKP